MYLREKAPRQKTELDRFSFGFGYRKGIGTHWSRALTMTVGITCTECGSTVAFWLDGSEEAPTATCDTCRATYQMRISQVRKPEQEVTV